MSGQRAGADLGLAVAWATMSRARCSCFGFRTAKAEAMAKASTGIAVTAVASASTSKGFASSPLWSCPPPIMAIGMLPALCLFILFCLRVAERMSWRSSVAIAVGATAGSWLLFERLLQVQLPRGLWG